jgi:hypothetical protein
MKLSKRLVILLLVYGIACSVVTSQSQSQNAASPTQWKRYNLGKGAFSVLFPEKPTEEFKASPPTLTLPIDLYVTSVATANGVFVAQYSLLGDQAEKWQESTSESFYSGLWDGIASSINKQMEDRGLPHKTVIEKKQKTTFSGQDGREIIFTLGPLKGRLLMTRVGRHAFAAVAMRTEQGTVEDQDRFLNSFTINPELVKAVQVS